MSPEPSRGVTGVQSLRIAVVGAGTMGRGIAAVAAVAGHAVALTDDSAEALARAPELIERSYEKAVAKGTLHGDEPRHALSRLATHATLEHAVCDARIVIEAIPESIALKQLLFARVERVVPRTTVLATNTSSLPIAEIAATLAHPERVVGMHFFNPVAAMQLVEVVRGLRTAAEVVDVARSFAESLGKTPIVVRDSPGFATSRLGVVLGLEAIRMVEQGVASASDIDRAMMLGYNHPVGPLRLGDLVGLDVRLAIADHLHATLGGDTYRAPQLLRAMVAAGKLGKKSGEGFYRWDAEQ